MLLHLHLPGFHATVQQAVTSRLAGRPVAVAIDAGAQAPLIDVSPEARKQGVFPGLRAAAAVRRCPGLAVTTPQPELYRRARRALMAAANTASPLVGGRADGLDVDLAGSERLWRDATGSEDPLKQATWWARTLHQRIREDLHLPTAVGVAGRLRVARLAGLAARDERTGVCVVTPATEAVTMHAWPIRWVRDLPWEHLRLLSDCGITTLGAAAAMPPADLRQLLGDDSEDLLALFSGDDEPLVPPCVDPEPEIAVARGAGDSGADATRAARMIAALARDLGFRLRADNLACTRLTFAGTWLDGRTTTRTIQAKRQLRHDDDLERTALGMLAALMRRVSWQRLSLTATGLCSAEEQQELFDAPRVHRLENARDLLRRRFGTELVSPATQV
jgi:DNA polymerase IV